jgi:hypothetical protein
MGPIRNPRWEQKRTEGYVIVSTILIDWVDVADIRQTFYNVWNLYDFFLKLELSRLKLTFWKIKNNSPQYASIVTSFLFIFFCFIFYCFDWNEPIKSWMLHKF